MRFLWEARDLGRNAWGDRGGAAGVVDDVADLAETAESDGDHVVKADVWLGGNFDGAGKYDIGMPKHAVDAEPPGLVAGDGVGDFVGCPPIRTGRAGEAGSVGGSYRISDW